ncbi:SHOCT domain-containing protein [Lactiplantibacillus plantarum]|uniref:SHOCT domain-containing protein n=1 Tax=Lactiplantibacillus plantarum TaxID=1590 RepID=UPI0021824972|nr:SHOCT domain-containing protein [Lactiplantibacillus plantarum]
MSIYYQPSLADELVKAAGEAGISDVNTQIVALKGSQKEYLFADQNQIRILKKGFMTGHTFGAGIYQMNYQNISGVRVESNFLAGYFEVSAGGMQNTRKSYWADDDTSAQKSPNTISLAGKGDIETFKKAADIINNTIAESRKPTVASQPLNQEASGVDQLREYKKLLDEGIIDQADFDAKKKQILGI